jgi:hypothetical protein
MVDLLVSEKKLSRDDAYMLCSAGRRPPRHAGRGRDEGRPRHAREIHFSVRGGLAPLHGKNAAVSCDRRTICARRSARIAAFCRVTVPGPKLSGNVRCARRPPPGAPASAIEPP